MACFWKPYENKDSTTAESIRHMSIFVNRHLNLNLSAKLNLCHDELLPKSDIPILSKCCNVVTLYANCTISGLLSTHSNSIHVQAFVTPTHMPCIHIFANFILQKSFYAHAPTIWTFPNIVVFKNHHRWQNLRQL